ncbi:MAG: hypothetical protein ACI9U6_002283 [Loktanella salsilacus]|uniref:COG2958 family protein n=2 Tax=Loktanella salsilacus TaxID=195913 RepID=UPI003988D006
MIKFSISKFVPEFLHLHPDEKFTAREISEWIMQTYPEETEAKRLASTARKSPLNSPEAMLQQIVAEIGAQRPQLEKNYSIRTSEERPRKYYFTEKTLEQEVEEPTKVAQSLSPTSSDINRSEKLLSEHDLYPILSEYLKQELGVFSKRIDERRSTNNRGENGNRWLYPDIVGMEDLSQNWDRDVIDCAKEYSDKKTKLWSFEVKLKLNSTNVRESFFQAVSNSSWANHSYLVAAEIVGSITSSELRLLSGLHGVGLIRLDTETPSDSQIVIPSSERADVDWGSINRLVEQNSDFRQYVKLVRQFYQTGDSFGAMWD